MIHDKLNYRFLESSEKDIYLNFIKSFDKIYESDPKHFLDYIDKGNNFLTNDQECPTVGAFEDNNLVASFSGFFSGGPVWFAFNQFLKLQSTSLASAIDYQVTSMKLQNLLIANAENEGYYNFFGRKSIRACINVEKIRNRIIDKNYIKVRYDMYHDGFYPAGQPINTPGHDFYQAHPKVDSVIILHSLKQEERVKLLSKKYQEYKSAYE